MLDQPRRVERIIVVPAYGPSVATLGQGNVSTRTWEDTLIVKASGHNQGSRTGAGVAECRRSLLRALESDRDPSDVAIERSLLECRVDEGAAKPSAEALV